MTWYVVADKDSSDMDKERTIWTLSQNPTETGWATDMGCTGYGLTHAKAEALAKAANAAGI
jgi:hypothetical protein